MNSWLLTLSKHSSLSATYNFIEDRTGRKAKKDKVVKFLKNWHHRCHRYMFLKLHLRGVACFLIINFLRPKQKKNIQRYKNRQLLCKIRTIKKALKEIIWQRLLNSNTASGSTWLWITYCWRLGQDTTDVLFTSADKHQLKQFNSLGKILHVVELCLC